MVNAVPGIGLNGAMRGSGLNMVLDKLRSRSVWGTEHGHVCGQVANADKLRSRSWTGQGRGQLAGRCRTRSSHFTNTALAIARMIRRMRCGLSTGCQPGRCASAKRPASRIPAAIARTLPGCYANRRADIRRCCVRCLTNVSEAAFCAKWPNQKISWLE